MRLSEVKKLQSGDEVKWTDPDDGACSRIIKIRAVEIVGNVVKITEISGNYIEVFARELTRRSGGHP